MKKIIVSLLMLVAVIGLKAQEAAVTTGPMIEFEEKIYNFGSVVEGDSVTHTFKFKNIGTEPLKILSARGSCGCTVPKYTKEAIAPGASGEVYVKFDTRAKMGSQNKTVTLVTNAANHKQVILSIRGTITARTSDGKD